MIGDKIFPCTSLKFEPLGVSRWPISRWNFQCNIRDFAEDDFPIVGQLNVDRHPYCRLTSERTTSWLQLNEKHFYGHLQRQRRLKIVTYETSYKMMIFQHETYNYPTELAESIENVYYVTLIWLWKIKSVYNAEYRNEWKLLVEYILKDVGARKSSWTKTTKVAFGTYLNGAICTQTIANIRQSSQVTKKKTFKGEQDSHDKLKRINQQVDSEKSIFFTSGGTSRSLLIEAVSELSSIFIARRGERSRSAKIWQSNKSYRFRRRNSAVNFILHVPDG